MRTVLCHGCFDPLHLGHIRHFRAATAHGQYLIVTVTADEFVNKGVGRPVFNQEQRMEAIRALSCVNEVRLSNAPTAAGVIREIRPNIFAKGPDYSEATLDPGELQAMREVGAELLITKTEKFSSTALLRPARTPEIDAYLARLRQSYTAADVLHWLDKARTLRVLVIGEAIQDEYHYCNVLGKAGKEPILAAKFEKAETFVGGAEAVWNHARACSDYVGLTTGPTITKRRFIESYPFQKLFEVYEMDEAEQERAGDELRTMPACNLTIVADYGHGLFTQTLRAALMGHPKIAVNVQANAGNHGFSTISKYPKAAFVCISERELRLDARDQRTDVQALMHAASNRFGGTLLVTRGEHGCIIVGAGGYREAPALTDKTVDRVGAGDAVFAVTACCQAVGMPLDLIAFVASVVGTMAVGIVGNSRYIERDALRTAIQSYLA